MTRLWFGAATLVGLAAPAQADHDHMHHESPGHVFGAGVAVVAASFDTMLYAGNYEGVLPSVQWSRSRYGVAATIGAYRIDENGAQYYALGDAMVHGRFAITRNIGALLGASAPTGDSLHGTGMGHWMVMPALYAVAAHDRFSANATLGFSRALDGNTDHDHGAWPIVEPMLMSEVSWSAGGDVALGHAATVGVRFAGGIPAGAPGDTRAQAGLRGAWHRSQFDTAVEIQAGLVGDPFTVRGVVSTALSF